MIDVAAAPVVMTMMMMMMSMLILVPWWSYYSEQPIVTNHAADDVTIIEAEYAACGDGVDTSAKAVLDCAPPITRSH